MCGTPVFILRERSQMEPAVMHGGIGPKIRDTCARMCYITQIT